MDAPSHINVKLFDRRLLTPYRVGPCVVPLAGTLTELRVCVSRHLGGDPPAADIVLSQQRVEGMFVDLRELDVRGLQDGQALFVNTRNDGQVPACGPRSDTDKREDGTFLIHIKTAKLGIDLTAIKRPMTCEEMVMAALQTVDMAHDARLFQLFTNDDCDFAIQDVPESGSVLVLQYAERADEVAVVFDRLLEANVRAHLNEQEVLEQRRHKETELLQLNAQLRRNEAQLSDLEMPDPDPFDVIPMEIEQNIDQANRNHANAPINDDTLLGCVRNYVLNSGRTRLVWWSITKLYYEEEAMKNALATANEAGKKAMSERTERQM